MGSARRAGTLVTAATAFLLSGCWWGPVTIGKPVAHAETRLSGADRIVQRTYTDGTVTYGIVGKKEEFVSHTGGGVYDYGAVLESAFYASTTRVPEPPAPAYRAPAAATPVPGPALPQPPVDIRAPVEAHGHGGYHPPPATPGGYRPP